MGIEKKVEVTESSIERYRIVPPIPNGYAYWAVADTESDIMPNFALVTISIHLKAAKQLARLVAWDLNHRGNK